MPAASKEHARLMGKIAAASDSLRLAQSAIDARRDGQPVPPRPQAPGFDISSLFGMPGAAS